MQYLCRLHTNFTVLHENIFFAPINAYNSHNIYTFNKHLSNNWVNKISVSDNA